MALDTDDRVLETSTTAGAGAITVAGAVTGFSTFASVLSVGDTFYGGVEGVDANGVPTGEWELGYYTYSSANTITRTTPIRSSNANATVTFSAGTKRVFLTLLASRTVQRDNALATPFSSQAVLEGVQIPAANAAGSMIWSSSLNLPLWWDGSVWSRKSPAPVPSGTFVPFAYYGDSRADIGDGGTNQFDMRVWLYLGISGVRQQTHQATADLLPQYYPAARQVANGGLSGDNLDQMITRETAGASTTRKSLADMASCGVRVLIMRMSINQLTADVAAGAYVPATTTAIINKRNDIKRRAIALGMLVIDEGEWGFDYVGDAGTWPQTRIDNVRTAIAAINADAKTFAANSNGNCIYLDLNPLVADGTGQWLTGMCSDTANPGQRVHLSNKAGQLLGQLEAKVLSGIFGPPEPNYTQFPEGDYPNLASNPTLAAATGGLATGYSTSVNGTGGGKTDAIVFIDNKPYQECRFTWTGAGANVGQIDLPFSVSGGAPTIPVAAGEWFALEADVIIDNGAGGAPSGPVSTFDQYMRVGLENGANGNYLNALMTDGQANTAFGQAFKGRVTLGPFLMPVASAGLTAAHWRLVVSTTVAVTGGAVLRAAVGGARIVRVDKGDVHFDGNNAATIPAVNGTPLAPAADNIKVFMRERANRALLCIMGPSGLDTSLQPSLFGNKVKWWNPAGNSTTITAVGAAALSATGTATAVNVATTNIYTRQRALEYLVTAAATTAVAGFRDAVAQHWRGAAAGEGGFFVVVRWGPATGVATTTNRAFVGLTSATTAPTDVQPSSLTNMMGMGWDAADTNIQMMTNDGTGTATKTDLGASFPVPTADRTKSYEIAMFCAPGGTTVYWQITDLGTNAVATGQITTDYPTNTTLLALRGWMSVGGTSSVIGIALMNAYLETDT